MVWTRASLEYYNHQPIYQDGRRYFLGPEGNLQGEYNCFGIRNVQSSTRRILTAFPVPSVVIDQINKIGLAEKQPSLLTFYDQKRNPVRDDDNKLSGVDKKPEITGGYEETNE